jgi:hypothetical protein
VTGQNGAVGVNGTTGPTGPTGTTGATGRGSVSETVTEGGGSGPAGTERASGRLELISCAVKTVTGKRVQRCTGKPTAKKLRLAPARRLFGAVLARGKTIYATGSAARTGKRTRVLLTVRRRITKGTYTLTLRRGRTVRRQRIAVR